MKKKILNKAWNYLKVFNLDYILKFRKKDKCKQYEQYCLHLSLNGYIKRIVYNSPEELKEKCSQYGQCTYCEHFINYKL